MKMCQPHWDKLRELVEANGMSHLVAKNGEEAVASFNSGEEVWDPLMRINMAIMERAIHRWGPIVLTEEFGCPVCYAMAHASNAVDEKSGTHSWNPEGKIWDAAAEEEYYTRGPVESFRAYLEETGVLPKKELH